MRILIIGGGFAGCSSAEILSKYKDNKITIVEKNEIISYRIK